MKGEEATLEHYMKLSKHGLEEPMLDFAYRFGRKLVRNGWSVDAFVPYEGVVIFEYTNPLAEANGYYPVIMLTIRAGPKNLALKGRSGMEISLSE